MMKLKKKINKYEVLDWLRIIFCIVVLIVAVVCIVIKFWVIYEYADTPISEVPTWAWFWLQNGGGK